MRKLLYLLAIFLTLGLANAQQNYIFDTKEIKSLRLIIDGDPLLPPVIRLGGDQHLALSFDVMTHHPQRLVYHISHCNYLWQKDGDESLFESDYLKGINGRLIENYEKSFNTNQNYTHYELVLPNEDIHWLLSGNYCIEVFQEDAYDTKSSPLLRAEFCVVEPGMNILAEVSGNTDKDFNQAHQQLSFEVRYGNIRVINPTQEIHTVVMQNGRKDNAVINLSPNLHTALGLNFTHRRELIFPATNEFHKFEIIDMHRPCLNVDYLRWLDPYYHATLLTDKTQHTYTYDEDQNGRSILRNVEYDNQHITSEYVWVHFTLPLPHPLEHDVYVCGAWTNGTWDPDCHMYWDEKNREYKAAVLLKQGYYNYQYRQRMDQDEGSTNQLDGNFYETENQYTIYVYYRRLGERYDRLVAYRTVSSR